MSIENIENLIQKEVTLPSPPVIAVQILHTVQNDNADLKKLVEIISADPALTVKMLKIANSSFYSLKNDVTSIDRALSVLGTNVIKNIALSFVIATDFRGDKNLETGFDFDDYWRRSVTAAVAAELLANQLQQYDDDIFVTALLHDIGMLVIYLNNRDTYGLIFQEARFSKHSFIELEQQRYGFNHQQVGALLIKEWGLPDKISSPIGHHHHPESAPAEQQNIAKILQFADHLSSIYNDSSSAEKVREFQKLLEKDFKLKSEDIRSLLDEVATKSVEILTTFEIEPGDMKPYSQMLQEANEELGRLNLSYEQLVIELKEARDKSELLSNELKEANDRLNSLVYIDALTDLYNHRYFQESLNNELLRAKRYNSVVSLLLFDIDHFKEVNDNYGHPAGDKVLSNIANTIKNTVRPSDIVARYGGEEFAVILPETDFTGVKVFAARLRRCVEGVTTQAENHQIKVTISVGGTTFYPDKHKCDKNLLFKIADQGLYIAKETGRNRVTILEADNLLSPDDDN